MGDPVKRIDLELEMKDHQRIDCRKCKNYYVTWEPDRPHGCRAMGFKSYHLPSAVVFQNSRCKCQAFEPKKHPIPK